MRLVPRQLKRSGMTGNVPYYGGRLSPAQAYAASHPVQVAAPPPPPVMPAPVMPVPATPMVPPAPPAGQIAPVPDAQAAQSAAAVQQLVASGVLTPQEAASIRARIGA